MVRVKKREKESTDALIRRFKKRVQQSGSLYRARKRRFYAKKKSKRQSKEDAIRRSKVRKEKELLKRLGKLPGRNGFKR